MYKKILVPLDGSERAEKILPHVEGLANCFGAQVVLLQIVELATPLVVDYDVSGGLIPDLILQTKDDANSYLATWKEKFTKKGIQTNTFVERGPVVDTIIKVAKAEGADLIAMASHGRSGLSHVFYGSVAIGVLHRADRPLLLIRSQGV